MEELVIRGVDPTRFVIVAAKKIKYLPRIHGEICEGMKKFMIAIQDLLNQHPQMNESTLFRLIECLYRNGSYSHPLLPKDHLKKLNEVARPI